MTSCLRVSLVATIKDEIEILDRWLEGISLQTRLPDEVIIVDGGSGDGTWEALQLWNPTFHKTLERIPGASISAGRNAALAEATGDIIAITDCGTVAEPAWLERLTAAFDDPSVDVASGFFYPLAETAWERSLAATTLPEANEIRPERFLPSSRSVAVRAAWVRRKFEYPEWLDYCEDLIWDLQLRDAGALFMFVPNARVGFFVRPSLRSFWHQYFRYARGDGKAGLFGKRHAIRYATYAAATVSIGRRKPVELAIALALACAYLYRPVRRAFARDARDGKTLRETLVAVPLVPIQMAAGDLAKMSGYPVGVVWRWKRFGAPRPGRNWRRVNPSGQLWDPGGSDEVFRQRKG